MFGLISSCGSGLFYRGVGVFYVYVMHLHSSVDLSQQQQPVKTATMFVA